MGDRYHKAARDGLLEVLKEATKKEINTKDVDGMTPVLWAAFEGRLDTLRMLVGRGGNPDKSDQFGNTALHLASAKGHFSCVDFLVKFGANIFALDIDNHNPQQLAAINNRDDILRYLDAASAHLEATDKKKANGFKEKAKKHSEKRIKEFLKRQQKQEEQQEAERSNMLKAMKHKFWTGSHGNLSKLKDTNVVQTNDTFSTLVGTGTVVQRSAAQRKIQALKQTRQANANVAEFKVGDAENGGRSVRSIEGIQRDSEVLYVGTFQNAGNDKRGKLTDVFEYDSSNADDRKSLRQATLSRCLSQPDFLASGAIGSDISDDIKNQRPSGLFDRPGLGSLSIPRSVTSVISQMSSDQISNHSSSESSNTQKKQNGKKTRQRQLVISDSEDSEGSDNSSDEHDDPNQPLKRFLAAYSLDEHFELLVQQQIDLDTLMLLTDDDLKILNLPLGPYRRLAVAIQERKSALTNPGAIIDSRL
ncbi:CLUMA_CG009822, isoform A [Clunio marinus]|uniref:CLUMA_CG009822, isoform A n=1 Tax=Clunio marinus TaxID=568069 RepID=A0A1J1I7Z9_9DIPT|nr:CLUMA_CG009822, isoform A [Clunio marinus]